MKANKKIDVAVADWKDVDDLLQQLARIIKRRTGLTLQTHDIGSDDLIVTVAESRISEKQMLKAAGLDDVYEVR